MNDEVNSIVDKFYSNYISRDLANLLGGSLFIEIIWFSLNNEPLLFPVSWEESFIIIGFLAVSYLIGVIFDRLGDHLFSRFSPLHKYPNADRYDLLLRKDIDKGVLNRLERTNSLWILGKSVGFSALLGGVLMVLIKYSPIKDFIFSQLFLAFLLIVAGLFMMRYGKSARESYLEARTMLLEPQQPATTIATVTATSNQQPTTATATAIATVTATSNQQPTTATATATSNQTP